MDVDSILSQFGEKPKSKAKDTFDVDSILSEFGGKPEAVTLSGKPSSITITPKPPISGLSKESSDELNQTRVERFGGENPRSKLPTTNIVESIGTNYQAGKDLAGEGISDLESKHLYKGLAKTAGGAALMGLSPLSGLVEGGVETPVTDITGDPNIGKRAGFVASSAIPINKGLGALNKVAGATPVINKLSTYPKNKALSTLIENIGEENLPSVVSAMKANPRLAPADLSPRVLQDTQHLFANEGPQIDYLAKTSGARMATRKNAIEEAYDASAGVSPNLVQKINSLAKASKDVGTNQINPLVKAAKPVDVSKTLENINNILKPGVMSKIEEGSTLPLPEVKRALAGAKEWLTNGKELKTGAEDLHDIQKALRRQGYSLTKSGNAGEREIGHALLKVRNDLVADIDKASPGYSKALSNYRDEMHIADAFKQGHDNIFSSSKKIENDPSFTKKWFDGLSDHEKEAAKEGARTAIYTEMGVAKNPALAGESIARSDFNKAKMEILFGKEETGKLLDKLAVERAIANTHNKIVENSQTAMRAASKSQFAMPTKTEVMKSAPMLMAAEGANFFYGGYPGIATGAALAAKTGAAVKDSIAMKLAREHNAQYAKLALPVEGPSRDALIQSLEAAIPRPKLSMLNRVKASLPVSP